MLFQLVQHVYFKRETCEAYKAAFGGAAPQKARLFPTQDCSLSPVLRGLYQGFATLSAF